MENKLFKIRDLVWGKSGNDYVTDACGGGSYKIKVGDFGSCELVYETVEDGESHIMHGTLDDCMDWAQVYFNGSVSMYLTEAPLSSASLVTTNIKPLEWDMMLGSDHITATGLRCEYVVKLINDDTNDSGKFRCTYDSDSTTINLNVGTKDECMQTAWEAHQVDVNRYITETVSPSASLKLLPELKSLKWVKLEEDDEDGKEFKAEGINTWYFIIQDDDNYALQTGSFDSDGWLEVDEEILIVGTYDDCIRKATEHYTDAVNNLFTVSLSPSTPLDNTIVIAGDIHCNSEHIAPNLPLDLEVKVTGKQLDWSEDSEPDVVSAKGINWNYRVQPNEELDNQHDLIIFDADVEFTHATGSVIECMQSAWEYHCVEELTPKQKVSEENYKNAVLGGIMTEDWNGIPSGSVIYLLDNGPGFFALYYVEGQDEYWRTSWGVGKDKPVIPEDKNYTVHDYKNVHKIFEKIFNMCVADTKVPVNLLPV